MTSRPFVAGNRFNGFSWPVFKVAPALEVQRLGREKPLKRFRERPDSDHRAKATM